MTTPRPSDPQVERLALLVKEAHEQASKVHQYEDGGEGDFWQKVAAELGGRLSFALIGEPPPAFPHCVVCGSSAWHCSVCVPPATTPPVTDEEIEAAMDHVVGYAGGLTVLKKEKASEAYAATVAALDEAEAALRGLFRRARGG